MPNLDSFVFKEKEQNFKMTEYVPVENNKRLKVSTNETSAEAEVLEKNGHVVSMLLSFPGRG